MAVKVTGVKEIVGRIATVRGSTAKGTERGIVKATQFLLRQANGYVPVDTGNLKASGQARKEGSGFSTTGFVTYLANYAIYVHENLDSYHKPPTQAKFLERPAIEYREDMREIIRTEATL